MKKSTIGVSAHCRTIIVSGPLTPILDFAIDDPVQHEARTVDAWLAAARQRQAAHVGPMPPRSIAGGVRMMVGTMGMSPSEAQIAAPSMAFWQMFFPSVMGRDPQNFADVRRRMPRSFAIVRDGVARHAHHPRLVFSAFHMSAFALIGALLVSAVTDVHGARGHVLVAQQNLAWLRTDAGRWIAELNDVIPTNARGLRQLQTGLRDGSIRRLMILVDGPAPPGRDTHPLTGLMPLLGFKTALIRRLIDMDIPILPITHAWSDGGLDVEWQPLLARDSNAALETTAGLLESLLRRHPEQWVNWATARTLSVP